MKTNGKRTALTLAAIVAALATGIALGFDWQQYLGRAFYLLRRSYDRDFYRKNHHVVEGRILVFGTDTGGPTWRRAPQGTPC